MGLFCILGSFKQSKTKANWGSTERKTIKDVNAFFDILTQSRLWSTVHTWSLQFSSKIVMIRVHNGLLEILKVLYWYINVWEHWSTVLQMSIFREIGVGNHASTPRAILILSVALNSLQQCVWPERVSTNCIVYFLSSSSSSQLK